MPEALKCPTCAAPLDYPKSGEQSMRCPYCNSTVILPGAQQTNSPNIDLSAILGPMLGKSVDIAQLTNLLQSGRKIEAIKIFRQSSGMGLAEAKDAVEKLAAGQSPNRSAYVPSYNSIGAAKLASSGTKFGLGLTLAIIIFTFTLISIISRSVHKPLPKTPGLVPTFNMPQFTIAPAPAVPTFAHMTMEFGTEGIGAGQFKDSRSVAVDGNGHIYVGEYSDGRIQIFDPQGKFLAEWSLGRGKYLSNLTADHHGNVYVLANSHIYRYEGATGMLLNELENTLEDNVLNYSDAFAALNGDVYAIDLNSDIVDIGPDGKIKATINAKDKVGEDVDFQRIVVLPTGEMFALDRMRGIFKFSADGRYINRFGGGEEPDPTNRSPDHLSSPNNLAIDGHGRIYVSDNGPAIHVFDGDGHYVDSFGGQDVVFGLTINDQNEIFACFRNKHAVRKFVLDKP
jgi:sugar lactone lactonase YvrE/DNA-directed RNA polymerase subunit RPC12/RpoP